MYGLARFISSRKGSWIIVMCWLLTVVIISAIAPGAKQYAISSGEGSIYGHTPSAEAEKLLKEQFPSDEGMIALLVFHTQDAFNLQEREQVATISEWLSSDNKPAYISEAMPFHLFPADVQAGLFSEDQTTVMLNVTLQNDLDSTQIRETLNSIREHVENTVLNTIQFEITGPAGIAADTGNLFANADLVLLFATIGLILIILILIYRSPLLAIIPLIAAGIVYGLVDRVLGMAASNGWMVVDKQALSIMMILLFAVLTDYSLFIVSRYREELKTIGSRNDAMKVALSHVAEPILFSGGTVLIAVMALFIAVFEPYHYFAPVFSVAMAIILLGGLTLIPAIFTITGRRAFWPFMPKLGDPQSGKARFWSRVGSFVIRKPALISSILLIMMLAVSLNIFNMNFSFNLLKSFPDDMSSRQGFTLLENHFPKGELAPVTIVLKSDEEMKRTSSFEESILRLQGLIKENGEIAGNYSLSQGGYALKMQLILEDNPYEPSALQAVEQLRNQSESLLVASGFDPAHYSLHYAGQTAEQLDVRQMNERDTLLVFALIVVLISIMLFFQARSVVVALIMMATMLLSYAAALGLSWAVFSNLFGFDAVSYRLPMYAFIFLIALGVDYNIMLVSRILEERRKLTWKEAIERAVSRTGGVISSAGIVLAATFSVLITQPMQELFLFGFIMAIGILIDTFIVRGILLPSILAVVGKRYERKTPA